MYIEIKTALSVSFFQNMYFAYKKDYIILSILSIFLHKYQLMSAVMTLDSVSSATTRNMTYNTIRPTP